MFKLEMHQHKVEIKEDIWDFSQVSFNHLSPLSIIIGHFMRMVSIGTYLENISINILAKSGLVFRELQITLT